jgi:hypothetical protein
MAGNGSACGPASKQAVHLADRAVMPRADLPRSSTSTSVPRSARWKAIEQPMTPPPTTTTVAPVGMGLSPVHSGRSSLPPELPKIRPRAVPTLG